MSHFQSNWFQSFQVKLLVVIHLLSCQYQPWPVHDNVRNEFFRLTGRHLPLVSRQHRLISEFRVTGIAGLMLMF